ncbi:hypothetical protein EMIT0P74_90018 [Pseudomonas sp. IT-P74]
MSGLTPATDSAQGLSRLPLSRASPLPQWVQQAVLFGPRVWVGLGRIFDMDEGWAGAIASRLAPTGVSCGDWHLGGCYTSSIDKPFGHYAGV